MTRSILLSAGLALALLLAVGPAASQGFVMLRSAAQCVASSTAPDGTISGCISQFGDVRLSCGRPCGSREEPLDWNANGGSPGESGDVRDVSTGCPEGEVVTGMTVLNNQVTLNCSTPTSSGGGGGGGFNVANVDKATACSISVSLSTAVWGSVLSFRNSENPNGCNIWLDAIFGSGHPFTCIPDGSLFVRMAFSSAQACDDNIGLFQEAAAALGWSNPGCTYLCADSTGYKSPPYWGIGTPTGSDDCSGAHALKIYQWCQ